MTEVFIISYIGLQNRQVNFVFWESCLFSNYDPTRLSTKSFSVDRKKSIEKKKEKKKYIRCNEEKYIKIETVLCFDLRPGPKNAIPRWCTGRKRHIPMASNRKRSRGRIKAYNMGQGEGPTVPNRLMHRKRVTSELHDSYFLMTIKLSISKIQWAIVWALNYYLTQLSSSPRSSCQ